MPVVEWVVFLVCLGGVGKVDGAFVGCEGVGFGEEGFCGWVCLGFVGDFYDEFGVEYGFGCAFFCVDVKDELGDLLGFLCEVVVGAVWFSVGTDGWFFCEVFGCSEFQSKRGFCALVDVEDE